MTAHVCVSGWSCYFPFLYVNVFHFQFVFRIINACGFLSDSNDVDSLHSTVLSCITPPLSHFWLWLVQIEHVYYKREAYPPPHVAFWSAHPCLGIFLSPSSVCILLHKFALSYFFKTILCLYLDLCVCVMSVLLACAPGAGRSQQTASRASGTGVMDSCKRSCAGNWTRVLY